MRVSDSMIYRRAQVEGGAARGRMDEATARAASGLRVVHPGDDPAAAGLVTAERIRMQRLEAISSSTGRASDEIAAADAVLDAVNNALVRANELATQLGSSPYTAAERAAGAKEVQGLISTVLGALNTKVGSRWVLGGTADDAAPFDPLVLDGAGNVDTAATGVYRGDAGVRQLEIAPGVIQDASVRADVAVRGAGGGADAIAILGDLANALAADDPVAVAATQAGLTQATTQVSTARGMAGAIMNALDSATAANKAARDDAEKRISTLADADVIQAASDLALAQHALEAALTATAQSFKFSLLGKI
jgi:flagellar hook-associated protein 3 FlgL